MIKTYDVRYSSNSKKMTKEEEELAQKELSEIENVISVKVSQEGQIFSIEAEPDDFTAILDRAINIFRRHDAKSEVTYEFALNENY
ncbi:MAG: hypothetical protein KHZ87_07210 [Clostridiales bacterium]|nr:hypothetical protein [Clostridiales bacterium]MBS5877860.1 hypothetical protein [Clostridiales bacterium]MDU0940043.1 hypothetical protein [Clostridiales bacterium]MDU1041700.1 hypothetical protein [Clostridiales bacterium]MDU3490640.1 hypothetical protein [Clostridiales bacterium]